jgi:hypothetical protein
MWASLVFQHIGIWAGVFMFRQAPLLITEKRADLRSVLAGLYLQPGGVHIVLKSTTAAAKQQQNCVNVLRYENRRGLKTYTPRSVSEWELDATKGWFLTPQMCRDGTGVRPKH